MVTWRNKKQGVVVRSSAETKFRAIACGIYDVARVKRLEDS